MRSCYIFLILALTRSVWCTDCPDRWIPFQGSCYRIGHSSMHYNESQHFCMQDNARLVEVETSQENMFLKDFLSDFGSYTYWLGMTDDDIEGIWKWSSTGQTIQWSDWSLGEPNNGHNEDCAVLRHGHNFEWADYSCTSNHRPLCEIRVQSHVVVG